MEHMGFHIPGMQAPPPMMNPPPQIFGGFSPDGLPSMPHLPPDLSAHMFPDSILLDESSEAKRRRIARACDMCRKKKIKCDGKMPSCTHCVNSKTECVFTQVEKKRTPPKGAKYIEGLENRLGRMEHLLRLSGLLGEDGNDATDLGELEKKLTERNERSRQASMVTTNSIPSSPMRSASKQDGNSLTPQSALTSPTMARDKDEKRKSLTPMNDEQEEEEEVATLSEMMCSLVTNQSGETRYIGSSSGFSILSPKGIQWVNSKTGDDSFQRMISEVSVDDHKWTNWKPEVFGDLFPRPVFQPLPPKHEALSLLCDYFENFNCMFPLFHQPTFMHLVERQYSSDPYQGSGWWASLNCALAIAYRLRVMSNLVPAKEDEKAWGHIKNSMGVFSELAMRSTDLLSVQALLGMALFMQGTPNPQPGFLLISTAIRLAHSIGLHKKGTGFNLNPIEIEQRKRVFWIAFVLDKELSLRSGRPPAQDDDDMNVELPDADPADNIGNIPLADGKGKMNLFRVMCEFAVIESNVYRRLYSTRATKQTDGELLNTIGELDQQLEEWKDRIPIDFRPEHEIKASHTPLILHIVMLHFTYYNCLTTIHRMSVHRGIWSSRLSNYAIQGLNTRPLNPRVFSSAALSTAAARASISLLKYIPQGDFSCVWMILYFPVSALVTLFGNILDNPLDPRAKSDTRLMNLVVVFLSMLGQEAEQGGVHRMLGICSEFERVAKAVIEKAEKDHAQRRKRKNQDVSEKASPSNTNTTEQPANSNGSVSAQTPKPISPVTPTNSLSAATPLASTSPNVRIYQANEHLSPTHADHSGSSGSMDASPQEASPTRGPTIWTQDFTGNHQGGLESLHDYNDYNADMQSPTSKNDMAFQQPLLPHDLFSLPVTLDWNWAEMSGGAYPSVENGNFGGQSGHQHM
ncbi:hypothetical protein S7711_06454 [Stachybotrys chartarum IBT 7711]|uniref:Zn(2)-C6 fungal-type domain-containing protein n=1 Tax=Stachybotrys chartarum (strain CBS 109288 / IBT 7711) TaxID=1280523 RepID=A0A084AX70_STACB|nr:hypothetical protein S7711_06454 [Stachybotrys chartarum IBT 7711]